MIYWRSKEGAISDRNPALRTSTSVKCTPMRGQKVISILYFTSQSAWGKNKNMKEEGLACPSFFDYVCYNRNKREPYYNRATLTNKRAEVSSTLFLLHYS